MQKPVAEPRQALDLDFPLASIPADGISSELESNPGIRLEKDLMGLVFLSSSPLL